MQATQPQAMTSIQIHSFTDANTEAVVALWKACDLTRPWNNPYKDIQRKLAVSDDLFLVASLDDRIVGTVMGGYEGHRGWINYLAVEPACRQQGLGRKLMQEIEKRLLALDCPKINLQIRETNTPVIAFYEAIGFTDDKVKSYGKRLIPDN